MLFIIGMIVVFGSVVVGYTAHGGKLGVLWQPFEVIIIFGAAIGAFLIGSNGDLVKDVCKSLGKLMKGKPYKKKDYMELLLFLFTMFKLAKAKGMLAMEEHIENPEGSEVFKQFPSVLKNHHAVQFFSDHVRLLTMGMDNHYQMEDLMDKDLELHHHELHEVAHSVTLIGESLPALGIVAAVLGVITTMGSISEPPEVLGGLIGAALVGTFLGVLMSYGVVSPMGSFLGKFGEAETSYLQCIKIGILMQMQGNAPVVSVEFVRKNIPPHEQPTFTELEQAIESSSVG